MNAPDSAADPAASTDASLVESLVFGAIVVVFLICCVLAWWMVQHAAVPGAPGAPIG